MRPLILLLGAAVALTACGPTLTDAERIWCASGELNPFLVESAARDLDIFPTGLPEERQPVEGATPEPDPDRISLGDRVQIGEDIYYNFNTESNPEYEAALEDWRQSADGLRACKAAYELHNN